jgi:hypothetical protein
MSIFTLKIIAVISMLADHTGRAFFGGAPEFIIAGRLAMPIFCFMIAEGIYHTRNIKKYMLLILATAVISQEPLNMYLTVSRMSLGKLNILFTFSLAIGSIWLYQEVRKKTGRPVAVGALLFAPILADGLNTEYGIYGVLTIYAFYFLRNDKIAALLTFAGLTVVYVISAGLVIQMYALFAVLPLFMYNGRRGLNNIAAKYFFYVFYPAHMMLIYWGGVL